MNIFLRKKIWKEYGPYIKYPRTIDIYDDYVSIIDLLMNVPQKQLLKYITSNE